MAAKYFIELLVNIHLLLHAYSLLEIQKNIKNKMKCAHHSSTTNNQINFHQQQPQFTFYWFFLPNGFPFLGNSLEYLMKAMGLSQEIKTRTKFCIALGS